MEVIVRTAGCIAMEINKKELKILSLNFRSVANRLINCNWQTGMDLLKKFICFIDSNEIISDFIQSNLNPDDFNSKDVRPGVVFISTGDTEREEISFTYQFLKYEVETCKTDIYRGFAYGYAKDANNSVKEFCNRIILPFVNYIEGYLTRIGIQMGYDEDAKYQIVINSKDNLQVNLAVNGSSISASQSVAFDVAKLETILSDIKSSLDEQNENKQEVYQILEAIEAELKKEQPKKSVVDVLIAGLKGINESAQFLSAVAVLVQFVSMIN